MDTMFLLFAYFVGCFSGHINIFLETKFLRRIKDEDYIIQKPVYRALLFGIVFALVFYVLQDISKSSYIFAMFFICYLIAMIDLRGSIIPNKLVITILIASLISVISGLQPTGIIEALFGLLLGFLMLAIPYFSGAKIGGGDVKLLAVMGFCVGYMGVAYIMIFVGVLNLAYMLVKSIVTKRFFILSVKDMIPMAPFITTSFMLFLLVQSIILK